MTEKEAIEIINDVTWKDFGRHPDFPEARDMAISALEKQIAKKPYRETVHRRTGYTTMEIIDTYTCECHNTVNESYRYCLFCGQRLDFTEV